MASVLRNRRVLVLSVVFALLGAVVAVSRFWTEPGGTGSDRRPSLFDRFDRDGNGVARRSEVPAELRGQFEFLLGKAGQRQTGALTRAQFQRALRARAEQGPSGQVAAGADEGAAGPGPAEERHVPPPAAVAGADNGSGQALAAAQPPAARDTGGGGLQLGLGRATAGAPAGPQPATTRPEAASKTGPPEPASGGQQQPAPAAADRPSPATAVRPTYAQARLFELLDRDKDRRLAAGEIPAGFRTELMQADGDGDGRLSLAEFAAGIARASRPAGRRLPLAAARLPTGRHGGLIARPGPNQPVPVRRRRAGPRAAPDGLPDWFAEYDIDGDNQVAQHEWTRKAALDQFKRLDRNQDGFVTAAEAARAAAGDAGRPTTRNEGSN